MGERVGVEAAERPVSKARFIRPGSVTELRVLMELAQKREVGPWPPASDGTGANWSDVDLAQRQFLAALAAAGGGAHE